MSGGELVGWHQGVLVPRDTGGEHRPPPAGPPDRRQRGRCAVRRGRDWHSCDAADRARPLRGVAHLLQTGREPADRRSTRHDGSLHPEAVFRRRAREGLMTQLTIGSRAIGAGQPCFIIAEAGINHNGDVKLASDLVEAAAAAGADAIKFQTHFPEHEMLRDGATASYVGESLFDLLTRTAISRDDHFTLRDLAARKGIIFLSTPFSREAADFLET